MSTNMEDYFSRFPDFKREPNNSTIKEFKRLVKYMGWHRNPEVRSREKANLVAFEFRRHYGADNKLQNWQALCQELNLDEPNATITQCRKALARVYVNIWDLIESRRTGNAVRLFPDLESLRKHTRRHGKTFPKDAAKGEGFLKSLLRRIR